LNGIPEAYKPVGLGREFGRRWTRTRCSVTLLLADRSDRHARRL